MILCKRSWSLRTVISSFELSEEWISDTYTNCVPASFTSSGAIYWIPWKNTHSKDLRYDTCHSSNTFHLRPASINPLFPHRRKLLHCIYSFIITIPNIIVKQKCAPKYFASVIWYLINNNFWKYGEMPKIWTATCPLSVSTCNKLLNNL